MKVNYRKTCLWLLWTLVVGCCFSFSNEVKAESTKNWIDDILMGVEANAFSKDDIVNKFCDTMTWWSLDKDSEWSLKQSFFVAALCSNWNHNLEIFEEANKFIKKDFSYKSFGFQSSCQKSYRENCDVAELADNLLTLILSEMFSLREAAVFGIKWTYNDFSNWGKLKEWKNQFAKNYLNVDNKFCDWGNHKQTCKMLDNQIKQFKKTIKNLKFIDVDSLFEDNNIDCKVDKQSKDNIVYCWLVWELEWWLNMFVNLIYNEIEWYSIFSTFYWQILSQRDQIPQDIRFEYEQSFAWPEKFLLITEESINDLSNISTTYPVHAMLVAFQEDLLRMRDKYLVKVVTPIYCLYHKLRNVQFDK